MFTVFNSWLWSLMRFLGRMRPAARSLTTAGCGDWQQAWGWVRLSGGSGSPCAVRGCGPPGGTLCPVMTPDFALRQLVRLPQRMMVHRIV